MVSFKEASNWTSKVKQNLGCLWSWEVELGEVTVGSEMSAPQFFTTSPFTEAWKVNLREALAHTRSRRASFGDH